MATRHQETTLHAVRALGTPCPFCGQRGVQLWRDPVGPRSPIYQYQVRCDCGARGPWADCGEESAVPSWESVIPTPPPAPTAPEPEASP